MMDKYSAVWVSHSSIGDYLKCPRAYYLRNVYKNPKTGHKFTVMTPPLALGQAVHEVIESLATLPVEERFKISLIKKLDPVWLKTAGKKGGFKNFSEESMYRERALNMLLRLQENPGILMDKAIKIKTGSMGLPNYYLSEEHNIILCGKVDWLKYNDEDDSVQIVDFKTGKNEENEESLQLPIYLLLVGSTQSKKIKGASYWYLESGKIVDKELPSKEEAYEKVLSIALKIKKAREDGTFTCPKGGCHACRSLEKVLNGGGELVGVSETNQDIYILNS
jgi:ATP-dependent helicase/DNAse subunit B